MYYNSKKHPEHLADFRVFKKTPEEKAKAHTVKKQWQRDMRMFFGSQWRKHNNFPEQLNDV